MIQVNHEDATLAAQINYQTWHANFHTTAFPSHDTHL